MTKDFKLCVVVTSLNDLNWVFRYFNANHIRLVVSPGAVTAVTGRGELRVLPTISYARKGTNAVIVGIGDDPIHDVDATTVHLFSDAAVASPDYDDLLEKFLRLVLKRLPRSGSIFRPVVAVEGLTSLQPGIVDRIRDPLIRSLANAGAGAVVIDAATN